MEKKIPIPEMHERYAIETRMQIKGVAVASGGAQLFGRSQRRPMAESFLRNCV